MDKGLKWLGVCILLSAIVISAASVYKTKLNIESNERELAEKAESAERYIFNIPDGGGFSIIDKETGTIYYRQFDKFIECNLITKVYKESK